MFDQYLTESCLDALNSTFKDPKNFVSKPLNTNFKIFVKNIEYQLELIDYAPGGSEWNGISETICKKWPDSEVVSFLNKLANDYPNHNVIAIPVPYKPTSTNIKRILFFKVINVREF